MGRELQKKKARSGRQPVRQLNRTKKILNPRGNDAIAKNWYVSPITLKSQSLRQKWKHN
jgi:nucleolar protein 16